MGLGDRLRCVSMMRFKERDINLVSLPISTKTKFSSKGRIPIITLRSSKFQRKTRMTSRDIIRLLNEVTLTDDTLFCLELKESAYMRCQSNIRCDVAVAQGGDGGGRCTNPTEERN